MIESPALVLRAEGRYAAGCERVPWERLVVFVTLGGALYGLAMGSLEGRWIGALYSAIKVPILLTLSVAVCLPNFFVVNAVLGLAQDFRPAVRGILSAQGTLALCLAGLAPVTATIYVSRPSYPSALLLNALTFGLAAACAQIALRRHYRQLIERRPRHRQALAAWFTLYVFVGVKLGYVLRPFVGDPKLPVTFLRGEHWQDNPYTSLFWTALGFVVTVGRKVVGE